MREAGARRGRRRLARLHRLLRHLRVLRPPARHLDRLGRRLGVHHALVERQFETKVVASVVTSEKEAGRRLPSAAGILELIARSRAAERRERTAATFARARAVKNARSVKRPKCGEVATAVTTLGSALSPRHCARARRPHTRNRAPTRSKIRAAEQSGSLYGALAIAGAGTAAMLYLREQNDVALRQELDAVALPRHTPATPANAEALWTGEVTTTAQGLNGPVMLRGQRRGDVVEILSEPGARRRRPGWKSYLSCRIQKNRRHRLVPGALDTTNRGVKIVNPSARLGFPCEGGDQRQQQRRVHREGVPRVARLAQQRRVRRVADGRLGVALRRRRRRARGGVAAGGRVGRSRRPRGAPPPPRAPSPPRRWAAVGRRAPRGGRPPRARGRGSRAASRPPRPARRRINPPPPPPPAATTARRSDSRRAAAVPAAMPATPAVRGAARPRPPAPPTPHAAAAADDASSAASPSSGQSKNAPAPGRARPARAASAVPFAASRRRGLSRSAAAYSSNCSGGAGATVVGRRAQLGEPAQSRALRCASRAKRVSGGGAPGKCDGTDPGERSEACEPRGCSRR